MNSAKSAKSASPYGGDALFALRPFAPSRLGSFRGSTVKGNSNRVLCVDSNITLTLVALI